MTREREVPMLSIDTESAFDRLRSASGALARLNGRPLPDLNSKTRNAEAAVLTRELLRIDHMLDQAKVEVMSIYWAVKDQSSATSTGRTTT